MNYCCHCGFYFNWKSTRCSMCGEKIMPKGLICDICHKEKRQVIVKINNKGEVIQVCQNCNKKEKDYE